jgi:hypothetical protein
MTDNSLANLHVGNPALAQQVQREVGLPVVAHFICRDHNLLGLQSLLLAAHVMGLHHLLATTGHPARVGHQPGATSVFDLNSFELIELMRKFNHGVTHAGTPLRGSTQFTIGATFNSSGRNLPGQVARLRKKSNADEAPSRRIPAEHPVEIHPGHEPRQRLFLQRRHAGGGRQAFDQVGLDSARDQRIIGDRLFRMTA